MYRKAMPNATGKSRLNKKTSTLRKPSIQSPANKIMSYSSIDFVPFPLEKNMTIYSIRFLENKNYRC